MRNALTVLVFLLVCAGNAIAADTRLPELVRLSETSLWCKIELSPATLVWFQEMYSAANQSEFDDAMKSAKEAYASGVASQGPVSYCWAVRNELRENGFL